MVCFTLGFSLPVTWRLNVCAVPKVSWEYRSHRVGLHLMLDLISAVPCLYLTARPTLLEQSLEALLWIYSPSSVWILHVSRHAPFFLSDLSTCSAVWIIFGGLLCCCSVFSSNFLFPGGCCKAPSGKRCQGCEGLFLLLLILFAHCRCNKPKGYIIISSWLY